MVPPRCRIPRRTAASRIIAATRRAARARRTAGLPAGRAGDHPFRPAGRRAENRRAVRRPDARAVAAGRRPGAGWIDAAGRRTRRSAAGPRCWWCSGTPPTFRTATTPGRPGPARASPRAGAGDEPAGPAEDHHAAVRPARGRPDRHRGLGSAGAGYTASDTARRRGRPTSRLSSPAVASTAGGRPASRSTTPASGLVWSVTAVAGRRGQRREHPGRRRVSRHLVPAAQRNRPAGGDRDHRDGVGGRVGRVPEVLQHHHGPLMISERIRQRDRGFGC